MPAHRLAILTTHPIQYHAPWFRGLAAHPDIDLNVYYCHKATPQEQAHAGFDFQFEWDLPLLDGYLHNFLKNAATKPALNTFRGLDTPEIKEIIAREQFDAVLVNGWHYKSAWQAMRTCWKTGTPLMVRSDSHLRTERGVLKGILKWPFYRWFIPKLDACLPVGKWSSEYFLHYGAKPERVFIVNHAVDDNYFSSEAAKLRPQRIALRAQWGLDPSATVFLFAGKFVDNKRPIDFLKAIDYAAKGGARVAGLMVGDGPLRSMCEDFVSQTRSPVKFTGFLNQSGITSAYVVADSLVLPSKGETWGLVVNEAMVCGLPCFVSDQVGCSPDMIVQDETGGVFRSSDTEGLSRLLRDFAGNESKRRSMSQLAKETASRHSIVNAVTSTVEAVQFVSRGGSRKV